MRAPRHKMVVPQASRRAPLHANAKYLPLQQARWPIGRPTQTIMQTTPHAGG